MRDLEPAAEMLDREPLVVVDVRDADLIYGDDQDLLVERVGVLDFGAESQRRGLLLGLRKTATPGTRTRGGSLAGSPSRNSTRDPSLAVRVRVTIACPLRQVIITIDSTSAMR